jgi:hypothetical protein
MEVRFLRSDQRRRESEGDLESRRSYSGRVVALREQYAILALPVELWADRGAERESSETSRTT